MWPCENRVPFFTFLVCKLSALNWIRDFHFLASSFSGPFLHTTCIIKKRKVCLCTMQNQCNHRVMQTACMLVSGGKVLFSSFDYLGNRWRQKAHMSFFLSEVVEPFLWVSKMLVLAYFPCCEVWCHAWVDMQLLSRKFLWYLFLLVSISIHISLQKSVHITSLIQTQHLCVLEAPGRTSNSTANPWFLLPSMVNSWDCRHAWDSTSLSFETSLETELSCVPHQLLTMFPLPIPLFLFSGSTREILEAYS